MRTIIRHQVWGWLALAMAATNLYAFPVPQGMATNVVPQPPSLPAAATNAPGTNCLGPKIQFATPIYDFGRARNGELVKYSFVFTNTGDRTLEVLHVQPSCGCTTAADWTRTVEPGQTGTIPVQFNSANFNGAVFKTVNVTCKDLPATILQLKGTIWKPIDFSPMYAILNVPSEAPSASTVIRVVNNTEEMVTLSQPEINNRAFSAVLTTNTPGKEFQITVSTLPPMPTGTINAEITVKTSSTNAPLLKIPLWVTVQAALMVMPQQIYLPQAPLTAKTTPAITIQYNGTNSISLSDPAINVPGVDIQFNAMQAGRVYSAALTFPQGFELQPGQQAAFTLKTTHPQYPEIRVPIIQPARPVITPRPAPAPGTAVNPTTPVIGQPAVPPLPAASH